jgi:hypothetical protein
MVWGDFFATGPGDLYFMPRNATMNSEIYMKKCWRTTSLPSCSFTSHPFPSGWVPCHASKRNKKFLAEMPCEVVDLTGNNLDLNLTKNCWNYMKKKLKKKGTGPVDN